MTPWPACGTLATATLLLAALVPAARAQEPALTWCEPLGGRIAEDGACRYLRAPAAALPLPPGPWPDDWFVVADPAGDVTTTAGSRVDRPDLDITGAWYREGRLGRQLARFLDDQPLHIAPIDAPLRPRDRFLMVGLGVDGEAFGRRPAERSVLLGVVTDDGQVRNDMPAAVSAGMPFWVGMDTLHQGGQFSTGDRRTGSTRLSGNGRFEGYYTATPALHVFSFPDTDGYLLLLDPDRVQGFRLFSQSTVNEEAVTDIVGDPRSVVGALAVDGSLGDVLSCAQLVQPEAPVDREAVVQLRLGRFGEDVLGTGASLAITLLSGSGDPLELTVAGVAEGDGFVFDLPLPSGRAYAVDELSVGVGSGDDVLPVRPEEVLSIVPDRFDVGDAAGVIGGSANCARTPFFLEWSDLCARLRGSPVIDAAVGTDELSLRSGGDGVVSTCLVRSADDVVGIVNVLRSMPDAASLEELFTGYSAEEGCTGAELDWVPYERAHGRSCDGEPPTWGTLTLRDGVLVRTEFRGTGDPGSLRPIVDRFEVGDLDGDGIPNHLDDDPDGDGSGLLDLDADGDALPDSIDPAVYLPLVLSP